MDEVWRVAGRMRSSVLYFLHIFAIFWPEINGMIYDILVAQALNTTIPLAVGKVEGMPDMSSNYFQTNPPPLPPPVVVDPPPPPLTSPLSDMEAV